MLKLLLLQQRSMVDRQAILSSVWDIDAEPDARLVDLLVFQIRRKLASLGLNDAIQTVRGCGYRISKCLMDSLARDQYHNDQVGQQLCFLFTQAIDNSSAARRQGPNVR